MPYRVKGTRLLYFPVPKAGCSSLKQMLLTLDEPEEAERLARREGRHPHVHVYYPTTPFRRGLVLRHFGLRWFCVVRDPLERFVSGYRNRVLRYRELSTYHVPEETFSRIGLPHSPDIETFALNLDAYMRVSGLIRHHFLPMTVWLGRRPGRYARIFPLARMDALQDWLRAAGVAAEIPHAHASGGERSEIELSARAQAALREYYAGDYAAYGRWLEKTS